MHETIYTIGGQLANQPEIRPTIKRNFEDGAIDEFGAPLISSGLNRVKLDKADNKALLKHYNSGKSFIGLTFTKDIILPSGTMRVFDGYIDLTKDPKFSTEGSEVEIVQKARLDAFSDKVQSVTYSQLERDGFITSDDYLFMPYVINKPTSPVEYFTATFACVYVAQQLYQQVKEIIHLVTDCGSPFTTIGGVLKVLVQIIYIIVLLLTLISLIKDLVTLIIQFVKFHAVMRVSKLLDVGAAYLGLKVQTELFSKGGAEETTTYMPIKRFVQTSTTENRILGFLEPNKIQQKGYPVGATTYGEFLRYIIYTYSLRLIRKDNLIILVDKQYVGEGTPYTLPPLALKAGNFTNNASELKANRVFSFRTDDVDANTVHRYKGTSYQIITQQKDTIDPELNLLTGLEEFEFPFALLKRKDELTGPEKVVKDFLDAFSAVLNTMIVVANAIIEVVNIAIKFVNALIKGLRIIGIKIKFQIKPIPKIQYTDLGELISNRIGMAVLESDSVSEARLFKMTVGSQSKFNKIPQNNELLMSAKRFYEDFHRRSISFLQSAEMPFGAQKIFITLPDFKFLPQDFEQTEKIRLIKFQNGDSARILQDEWDDHELLNKAMHIEKPEIFASNLIETYIEPDGS